MSDTDGVPIVPFGKFKGQPVTEMLKDRGYSDWFRLQAGMADRYPVIFNFVVGTTKPTKGKRKKQDTPEHNAMQARYLGTELRAAIGSRYLAPREWIEDQRGIAHPWPEEYRVTVGKPEFEEYGWDVVWDTYADVLPSDYDISKLERLDHDSWVTVYLELKPSISDDYPVVLRQVMDRRKRQFPGRVGTRAKFVVVTNELAPSSVTTDEVRAIFKSQRIDVLLTSELEQGQVAA